MLIKKSFPIIICIFSVFLSGCNNVSSEKIVESPDENATQISEVKENPFKAFYIYKDKGGRENHFNPSGFMGSVGCIKYNDRWTDGCQDGKTCIRIDFDIQCAREDQQWAGIYWLNPPNNWGDRKGGYNLAGAQKLTFWARGEVGGEMIQEFTIGGIKGDYPDTDKVVIGPVILTEDWREYTIDLRGKDLSYISGGFSWSTDVDVNPESCAFYLDEIRFE
ncbi:MAG: hypothetical protein H6755_02340 [Candidatus Omnitrophica bacterium]|nr:hypothetical protein [Candidatus Omnitrophota bacterium]MCB9747227.1 hypothetical protein [Candidatus Omnitrophota bacterium]